MNTYIETLKIQDGKIKNLSYHQQRVVRTIGQMMNLPLPESIDTLRGTMKHRVVYDANGQVLDVSTHPYTMRPIHSLRIITDDHIDYASKYEDRSALNKLFSMRGQADDILIIRDNQVSDTSYCNIVFEDETGLFTPSTPLLKGTKRQFLLDKGIIKSRTINPQDICDYHTAYLINSMIELGELKIAIDNIRI